MTEELDLRLLSVIREMLVNNHLSRRKRAYLVQRLGDPLLPLTAEEKDAVLSHPVIRARSKDLAKHLAH